MRLEGVTIVVEDKGSLLSIENTGSKIVLTGTEKTSGYWVGLLFKSKSEKNRLDFVEFSYAGGKEMVSIDKKTNIGIAHESSANITNSNITNCSGFGLVKAFGGEVNDNLESINSFANNPSGNVLIEN